jgi:hypothetical protein
MDLPRDRLSIGLVIPNKQIKHNYFIERGLASIIAIGNGRRLEVGLIGCEGMTGLAVVMGSDRSPNETFMQVGGHGLRISSGELRQAVQKSPSLHEPMPS